MTRRLLSSWPVVTGSFIATGVGVIVLAKEYMNGVYTGKEEMSGKTAIVTGANTGIGKEVARELAKRGCRVIMACRDAEKCAAARKEIVLETRNPSVVCRPLDLSSLASVRHFAQHFNKSESALHLLVNNAAVMRCPKGVTADGFETHIGVNHFGHFLLTMLLLPRLESQSTPGRVVNVSSVAHVRASINFDDLNSDGHYDAGAAYGQSKLANMLFTRRLAALSSAVRVYAVHPGLVNTDITRHMSFRDSFTRYILAPFMWLFLLSPSQGSRSVIYCALSPDIEDIKFSGKYFSRSKLTEPSTAALDDIAAQKLWLISEKWTKLK